MRREHRSGLPVAALVFAVLAGCTAEEGERCGNQPNGDHVACSKGLVCNQTRDPAVCTPPIAAGEPCVADDDGACAGSLTCNGAYRPPVCRERAALSAPCGDTPDCKSGLVCNLAFAPVECRQPAVDGEPCGVNADCADPLVCILRLDGAGRCHAPSGPGGACDAEGTDCREGLRCNRGYAPAECRTPSAVVGTRCGGPEDCGGGLVCDREGEPPTCRTL